MPNDLTTQRRSVVGQLAGHYGMEADTFEAVLRATCMPTTGKAVTREEFAAFVVVCKEHGLNPITREIFAMRPKGRDGLIPVVSVDGWTKKINEHPACDGFEFRFAEELVTNPNAKPCPVWCEVLIYRKDRNRPTVIREFLDEVYQGMRGNPPSPGPWQTHTKRMLRHKALIQGGRLAFGFAGIYDEDEAERIADMRDVTPPTRGETHEANVREEPEAPARKGPPRGVQVIEHQPAETIEVQSGETVTIEQTVTSDGEVLEQTVTKEPAREGMAVRNGEGDVVGVQRKGPPRGVQAETVTHEAMPSPEDLRKRLQAAVDFAEDPDALQVAWERIVEPHWSDLFSPDQEDLMGIFRKRERELEP